MIVICIKFRSCSDSFNLTRARNGRAVCRSLKQPCRNVAKVKRGSCQSAGNALNTRMIKRVGATECEKQQLIAKIGIKG